MRRSLNGILTVWNVKSNEDFSDCGVHEVDDSGLVNARKGFDLLITSHPFSALPSQVEQ